MKKKNTLLFTALLGVFFLQGCIENYLESSQVSVETTTPQTTWKKPPPELKPGRYKVGFLIMDGVYNTELTAPFDIFQHTIYRDSIKAMDVFTVAQSLKPVRTFEGMYIYPDFEFSSAELPEIDILVVPSAEHHLDTDLENEVMLNFVKKVSQKAKFVTSHCDGAFVLAHCGLLDEVVSTTFPSDVDTYRQRYPQLEVEEDVWFVHDGKFITSAGGARSFEAALYLCELLYGAEVSRRLAQGLVIDWDLSQVPHLVVEPES